MGPKQEDSLTGKTFEKCRIIAKLGTGGMGSVWLAEHFGLGRKVAVKILPPEMGRDPEYVARFMREATTAGRMEHPNIVQIHDVGYAEGRHFIVMQYVDGESLSTVVENLGAMEPRDAAKIASGMLRGLQHAHEEGVVHRDVKPDNVLIAKGDEPKLLDFGLAIETETALQITKDGMVVGTPYYLAPEQARGQKATPLCDVYAAGVTLYYLITGKRPFVGATALAVLNKHIHEPPVPPNKHRPEIPKPLNDIVLKMMAKKPAERYQSAGAAADDLDAYLKGKQIQVKIPLQLPFGLSALTRKQLILAGASAGGGLLILLVLLIAIFSGGKPRTEQAVSKPPPPPVAIAELPESVQLRKCMELEKENKEVLAAWPDVLSAYDVFINSTASASFILKGKTARQEFVDFMEKRAELEFDRRRKETDPYRRVRSLQSYPRILIDLTSIDKRLREELAFAHGEAETKYLNDERQIDAALKENRFKEALTLLDALIPVSEGARQERLLKIKDDTQRREKDFEDETLRRVTQGYSAVHAAFEEALTKRETGTAYSKVTKFIRDQTGESERMKIRVPGLGYEPLLKPFPDKLLTDDQMLARSTISGAMNRARDTLGYRILSDLLDALDVEFLIRQATRGLDGIARVNGEIHLATFNATGKVTLDVALYKFAQKTGTPKTIDYRQLHVQDILQLAALPLELPVEQIFESNEEMCRTMGEMWVYSGLPQRWAQAGRCLQQAKKLGALGLDFRLEDFRERGYQEVRNRIASSRKEFERKNFDGAKQLLAEIEEAWKHDPSLKAEIGRAMATVLVAEVLQHDRNRDWTRLKAAARLLRTKYPKMYPEEVIFAPYANALRQTGEWRSTANLLNDDWTWEGRAQGTPCPAEDETTAGRGLKLKSEKPMRVAPVRSRGSTGAQVELTIAPPQSAFSTGFRFDVSDADGLYKKLVIRDTGEVTLYAFDGREEKRVDRGSLGKKLSVNQWVELAFAAEGGDLVCFVDQRPVLLTAVPVGVDRDIEIWSTATANFRLLKLRK